MQDIEIAGAGRTLPSPLSHEAGQKTPGRDVSPIPTEEEGPVSKDKN